LISEYKKSFDELEARRLAAVTDSNRIKKEEVGQIQSRQSRAFEKMNQEHIAKFNDFKSKVDSQYMGQMGELERERIHSQIQGENTRKKLTQTYADSLLSQAEFHEDQVDALKRGQKKMTDEQRATLEKQRYEEVNNLRDKMMKQSIDNQQKVADLNEKYQSLINTMKVDYEKRFRKQAESFREETDRQAKYVAMDRESLESKYQARINQLKDNFEREMEQVKRKQIQEKNEAVINKKA
jgi:hypothetical protein